MSKREELKALRAEVAELRKDLSTLSETLSIHLASCWQSATKLSIQYADSQQPVFRWYSVSNGIQAESADGS